jgi:hypothetical protein
MSTHWETPFAAGMCFGSYVVLASESRSHMRIFALDHSCESLRLNSAHSSSLPGFIVC